MALGLPPRKPKESKKARKARLKLEALKIEQDAAKADEELKPVLLKTKIEIPSVITVRDFASSLNLPVAKVLASLLKNGLAATINESIDFDTAAIVGDELGFEVVRKGEVSLGEKTQYQGPPSRRPPVVTVMGHVDHGKTTLLDAIRKTNVVATETGGITQHIGAYQVEIVDKKKEKRRINFLDTPGHEAFSAMRAHGANVTDIVVLVVAADDGVKPQTIEAFTHARAANVPVIVAINKIDLPTANPEKIKRELSELGLVPEEWGGKTIIVPVSAKSGQGIEDLLEMIVLTADMSALEAYFTGPAQGVIIESQIHRGLGPLATVLTQQGRLQVGDIVTAGSVWGKVRTIEDDQGRKIKEVLPGQPVRISGLTDVPSVGDILSAVPDEKTARERTTKVGRLARPTFRLADLSPVSSEAGQSFALIIKADVAGSLDAIKKSLADLITEEISLTIVHEGVGPISDSDINMAIASKAMVVGFKTPVLPVAHRLAEEKGVKIAVYDVIYQLIDDVIHLLESVLPPEIIEEEIGRLKVTHLFKQTGTKQIVGGKVSSGVIEKGPADIIHEGNLVCRGEVQSVQMEKTPVPQAKEGSEAAILFLPTGQSVKMKKGDVVVVKRVEKRIRHLRKPHH